MDPTTRFRGYLPVVVDVETAGFNPQGDALLELAAVPMVPGENGWHPGAIHEAAVVPFPGANLEESALKFTGIDPEDPLRGALPEMQALTEVLNPVRRAVADHDCKRAILVGHNAAFDHAFLNAAVNRTGFKRNPFHPFSSFDTATLAGLAYGHTVLARAMERAGLEWDDARAHSAAYDAERTAALFATIVNTWDHYIGIPDGI